MQSADPGRAAENLAVLPERIHRVIHRHVVERPDHPALVDAAETWTYGFVARVVADLVAWLRDEGVRPGDRVMIVSENSLPLAALVLATSKLSVWPVVLNPRLSAREIDQIRDHCQPRRVLYGVAVSDAARDHAVRHGATVQHITPLGTLGIGNLNEGAMPEPVEESSAQQVAALIYTSGTTGKPKGVMLTHQNLLFNALVSGELRALSPADRVYGVLPMSHIVGLANILLSSLMFGATIHVVPRYDPAELVRAIDEDGISVLMGVPATYQRLLEYKVTSRRRALPRGRLRHISVAGAPLDLTLKTRIESEWGLPLLNAYGITECAPSISGVRAALPRTDNGVGQPIPGIEVRLVGRDGKPVTPGEIGELHVRGPGVMRGYYKEPALTAAAIDPDGWFNTGDLARVHDESLFIVGRTKEMIIRSGFNVYPAEVEAVLNAHPAVVQSAVIGRTVAANEQVVAFVQLLPDAAISAAELMQYAQEQLTAYKRPSEIIILDTLPAGSTGKILKQKLAEAASVGKFLRES